jgi:hypothetical protein
MTFPEGRYGRRRQPRRTPRWVPELAVVLVIVAGLMLTGWLFRRYGDPFQPTVLHMRQETLYSVTFTLDVRKGPAVCRVAAKDSSGNEVGYAEARVERAGPVQITIPVKRSTDRVEVLGCRPA